ncbi:MAG: hypothetical protein ACRC7U_09600 [Moraxella sp.]
MSKNSLTLWQRLKNLLSRQMRASYQTPAHQNAAKHPCETTHSTADNVQLASNAAFDNSADHNMEAGVMTTQESEAPITYQAIESLLTDMGYQFLYHPSDDSEAQDVHHFTMQVSDKARDWGCMIRYFSQQQLIAVYSIMPTPVSEAMRADLLVALTHLNYDLMLGNLEMDLIDGELRFKTSLDLEVTGVNEFILSYLLQSNFSVFSRLYDTLTEMMQQPNPSQDLKTALDKLLNLQQSRHYFLASVAIQ